LKTRIDRLSFLQWEFTLPENNNDYFVQFIQSGYYMGSATGSNGEGVGGYISIDSIAYLWIVINSPDSSGYK
jgi:hypothetical protein